MRTVIVAILTLFTVVGTAEASHPERIVYSAHELADSAQHFQSELRSNRGGHAARDAAHFAEATRHFHRQVRHGRSFRDLWHDYQRLVRRYEHLRRQYAHAAHVHHRRHLATDFGRLAYYFAALDRAMYAEWYRRQYQYAGRHNYRSSDYRAWIYRDDRHYRGHDHHTNYKRHYGHHDHKDRTYNRDDRNHRRREHSRSRGQQNHEHRRYRDG